MRSCFYWVVILVAFVLPGCSTLSKTPTSERFSTHVFDNNSKQFTYRASYLSRKGASTEDDQYNDDPRRSHRERGNSIGDRPANPQSSGSSRYHTQIKKLEENSIEALDEQLKQNQFCREGYFLVERRFGPKLAILRGECHDLAVDGDRVLFPNVRDDAVRESSYYDSLKP
jgi:hypothetical protein